MTPQTASPAALAARARVSSSEALDRVRACRPEAPAVVLAVGPGAARRWRRALAAAGGAFASISSLESILAAAEDHALLPAAGEVDAATRIAVAGDVLRDRPEVAASFAADPQRLAALAQGLCDELALHGLHRVAPSTVEALRGTAVVRTRLRLLHAVLLAYRAELATRGVDLVARIERVVPALATAPRRAYPLVVEGVERLRPVERELLAALEGAGAELLVADRPAPQAEPGTLLHALLSSRPGTVARPPDGSFVRVACRDALEEAEAAARLVLARIEEGVGPEAIAVQAPRGQGYGDLLARVFAAHGVPLAAVDATPATAAPLYQAFRAFVRLFYRGPDPFDLAALLGAPGSGVRGGRRDAVARRLLEGMPADWAGVRAAILEATPAADPPEPGAPARPEAEVARHRAAREAALAIVEVLGSGPSGREVADPLVAARALRDAVLWFCGGIGNAHRLLGVLEIPDRDALGHRDAATALRAAATMLVERAVAGVAGAAAPFRDAAALLQAVEPLLPDLPDAVSDGALELRLGDDAGGPVDHLVVVGFSRGRWPTPAPASPLLGTLERDALRTLGAGLADLPRAEDLAVRSAEDARAVLGRARRSVVLLTPARDVAGAEAPPALLLVDLLRRMTDPALLAWRRAHEVRFGAPEAAAVLPALGPALPPRACPRHALAASARALGSGAPLGARERAAVAALLAAGAAHPLAAPWLPDRRFDVPVRLDAARREFSASQLEALLSCRYRYFTRHVLGLKALELVRQPRLSVATIGDVAHHVLEALGDRLTTAADDDVRAALASVLARRYPWALDGRYRADVAGVERELLLFVPAYQEVVRGMGWEAGASEVEFGERVGRPVAFPLDRAAAGAVAAIGADRLRLQGRIDRVDQVLVRGRRYRLVTDFKFGNVAKYLKQRQVGMGLQAALYPSALVQLGGPPPLGFAYFSVTSRSGNLLPSRDAELPPLGAIEVDPRDLETFQRTASELLTARLALLVGASAAGGAGDVTPHSLEERERLDEADADSCRWCDAWLLCRFGEAP